MTPSSMLATTQVTQKAPGLVDPDCALIRLDAVSKVFKTSAGDYQALKNIDLCFGEGEFVSIMGKSGSGKSTLINMITGIDHPSEGEVRVGDNAIHHMSEGKLAVWRGRTMGIVFQFFQLLPMLTVLENVMLPMDFCNVYPAGEREERARALLEMVGQQAAAEKLPAALSGGQQQTVAIARALANDPPIIVADEPTGNLDSRTAERILQIFADLATQCKTIIIVTHDPNLAKRATRRVLISDGELVNDAVAHALPHLPHTLLLKITHQVTPRSYEAGAVITRSANARAGSREGGLWIIRRGEVEVQRAGLRGEAETVACLGPGEQLSELDLTESPACELTFRAAPHGGAEVLWLPGEALWQMLHGSPAGEGTLRLVAKEHAERYCQAGSDGGGQAT